MEYQEIKDARAYLSDIPYLPAMAAIRSAQFWNGVSGYLFPDIYHSEQIVSTTIYTVTYTTKYNGKTKTFRSDVILKEKVSLEILLQHYEMTTIYINPKNDNQYYFDLDFLK